MLWNLMLNLFLILSQISLHLSGTSSFLTMKNMICMYPLICGKINFAFFVTNKIFKTIITLLKFVRNYYWSTFINSKLIGSLDLWNSFLLTITLSKFSVFSLILILSKNKTHLFWDTSFLYWTSCCCLCLWYSLILFFFWQNFVLIFFIFHLLLLCFVNILSSIFSIEYLSFALCKISFLLNQ